MDFKERADFVERFFEEATTIMRNKGRDYSGHEIDQPGDSNANFKRVGEALGIAPSSAAWVYALKHIDSISTYIKTRTVASEPIAERLKDLLNYVFIIASLLEEEGELS